MAVWFFLLVFVGMALYDADYTVELNVPIELELNSWIRQLRVRYGLKVGAYVGILLPTVAIGCIGYMFPYVLAFVLGMRTTLFAFQWYRRHNVIH